MSLSAKRTTQRLRIVVLSYVIRGPLGGRAWSKLHYLMGLSRLGHEVYYVEDSDDYPSCYDPARAVVDAVRFTPGPPRGKLTTVMLWESYPSREYNGIRYGMKSESFTPYLDLPTRTDESFELAIGSPTTPRDLLRRQGWSLCDARRPTRDPQTYQHYIGQSKAEFSVAKHGYVSSHSGWFSERSLAYLASGRPVLTQDTGFSDWLDADTGVLPFRTPAEVLDNLDRLNARYAAHCRAAREVAASSFNAQDILSRMLERAFQPAPAVATT